MRTSRARDPADADSSREYATARLAVRKLAHDLLRAFGERWAARLMPAQLMELMRHETIETTLSHYVGRNAERTAAILWHEHVKGRKKLLRLTVRLTVDRFRE